MTMATFIRKTFVWGWLTVQRFSPLTSWLGCGDMQADMVLEKELRVLHLDQQAIGSELYITLSMA